MFGAILFRFFVTHGPIMTVIIGNKNSLVVMSVSSKSEMTALLKTQLSTRYNAFNLC